MINQMAGLQMGALRERITIQYISSTDESTGQPVRTWGARYSSEPASFQSVAGTETIRGRQLEAGISALFVVNYHSDITVEDRVVFNSKTYGITYIKQLEGGTRYLELHCRNLP